tara:strand:- start:379 stop:744 length:366 start_codon:yes stop_codon:yes gene_type:complete
MNSAARRRVFATTAVVGVFVTWYFNIQFMLETGGFSLTGFVMASYANHASTSISNDLLVAVFTFLFWSCAEARRLGMKHWWLYVVATFTIAVAFAFPLFMYMRERALASAPQDQRGQAARR